MVSLTRKCSAAAVALVCAAHPLLPDAFVLHAHGPHHVHAHAIDLDAVAHRHGDPPGDHHETESAAATGETPRGGVIMVTKTDWLVGQRGRVRPQILSVPVLASSVASGGLDFGICPDGRLERSPPVPPPRARCPLDAVLLTSHALLI
jgi:hypothetical protein